MYSYTGPVDVGSSNAKPPSSDSHPVMRRHFPVVRCPQLHRCEGPEMRYIAPNSNDGIQEPLRKSGDHRAESQQPSETGHVQLTGIPLQTGFAVLYSFHGTWLIQACRLHIRTPGPLGTKTSATIVWQCDAVFV